MAHGKIRVNTLTYDTGSGDVDVAVSGIPTATDLNAKADVSALNAKADAANAALTGTPTAPTAAVSTNTTQLATTAFVVAEIADEVGTTVQAFDADTAKTDVAQNFTAPQRLAVNTLTSAASITIDFSTGNNFILTTGHAAIAFANPTTEVAGQSGSIFIVQGSTTCAAPTWGDQYLFAGGAAPALTGTTGKIARIDYIVQEAGKIHCVTTDNLTAT